ncbi:MAG: 23S rRNA (uracil(1939)-C(5))-methyltransferase RlmD, partial [Ignavibacteria bacterium]|nr:23S rRNA (uracil(1939)-C(5))-methyltransferase RlmD [Ignavibacteria bacterium]
MDKPKRDEIYEVTIDDIGAEGNGIGRINGEFVVFVPGTVPGDKVTVNIRRTKKNFAQAKLESIVSPSEFRVDPECEYFDSCNGCKMQNITYLKQLEIKRKIVLDSFERIGGFSDIEITGVLGSENIYFYRNKLEFSFSNDRWLTDEDMDIPNADRSFALGYHIPGFIDKILDIRKCYLQSDVSSRILNFTRDYFKEKNTSIYSSKIHSGYLRFLVIRQSANTSDLMVNLITFSEEPDLIMGYSESLKKEVPEVTTLVNAISASRAQVANAEIHNVIYGKGFIEEIIGKYMFKITPGSFFQTNSKQCERLFEQVVMLGEFTKNENVLDLYCGCGAISLYVSGLVKSVHGVELSRESIEMA